MTTLVTGAAGAIGAAVVAQLVRAGERVIAQDLGFPTSSASGTDVELLEGDLLEDDLYTRLAAVLGRGPLHRVIAVHGVDGSAPLAELTSDRFRRVMAINAESVIRLAQATRPALRQARQSSLVIVSSQAGLSAEADNVAYSASKFAVIGWAKAARENLGRDGIRVRVAAPGCTETPLFLAAQAAFASAAGVSTEAFLQRRLDRIPVGRFASTEQTAAAIVYLSDPAVPTPFLLASTGGETRH